MSKQSRELKRKKVRRRNTIFFGIFLFISFFVAIGYYRSNESQILTQEDFVNSESSNICLIKDTKYIYLDNFDSSNLNFPEGTKVSGYDLLTTSPLTINQDFLSSRINALQTLINNGEYNNWDEYGKKMIDTISQLNLMNSEELNFYKQTSCYAPSNLAELQKKLEIFTALNTGSPIDLTLTTFGIQDTGFIYSNISDYDKLANEAVLGSLNEKTLGEISNLNTNKETALKIINSDHFFALTSINKDSLIQGESETLELKKKYSSGLNNSEYYNMLITRVDRLRDFPELSFNYSGQNYKFYLVDVIQDSNQKILVLLIKDYLSNLADCTKIKADLNTLDLKAYIVPNSAIIDRDGKTYLKLLEKGYFTQEVEVHVTSYNGGEAVLSIDDNPDLNSGTSIKIYP